MSVAFQWRIHWLYSGEHVLLMFKNFRLSTGNLFLDYWKHSKPERISMRKIELEETLRVYFRARELVDKIECILWNFLF